jgi:hypothetical protein
MFGLQLAILISDSLEEFLDEENYWSIGEEDVRAELPQLARGAVSDHFNMLIDNEDSGWSEQLRHMPLEEALFALQSVRHVNQRPVQNLPAQQAAQPSGGRKKRRRRRRRGQRRARQEQRQETLFHPDEDASDPDNYDPEDVPGGPFYEGDYLLPRDQQWLADEAAKDDRRRRESYDEEEQPF